jgi:5'-phosphate synthase pdxT subunit
MNKTIGVLALQGGYREHGAHLRECGIEPIYVKNPDELQNCAGLIMPGGESSCLRRLLRGFELDTAIIHAVQNNNLRIWGTCAGAILCANEVVGEDPCLSLIEASVERNIFGSQLASFCENVIVPGVCDTPERLVYIRAPGIRRIWGSTRLLHSSHDVITAAENENILITSFHPELSGTRAFHQYFIKKCGLEPIDARTSEWQRTNWMIHG